MDVVYACRHALPDQAITAVGILMWWCLRYDLLMAWLRCDLFRGGGTMSGVVVVVGQRGSVVGVSGFLGFASIGAVYAMAPVRGYKKKRKVEKRVEHKAFLASGSSEDGSVDWWEDFSKRIPGLLSPSKGLNRFESVFKISRKTFDYICSLVKEHMMAKSTNFMFLNGKPMSLNDQVALALRRLSSGDSLITVGDSFGTNHSTVSQVTWRFVEAMEEGGLHHLQWPSTKQIMTQIKSKFENIRGLPNCCGAIDTTHIMMLLPSSERDSDVWLDEKENHSMILQAIVDPDMRFRDILTGWPGKMSDSSVLRSSSFFKLCEKGVRLNGEKLKLSEGIELGEYIVGDSGFPLLPWLVTPYQGRELPESDAEFNKRHFATRVVAQRALTRLKEVWRIIQGVMWRPDKHRLPRMILVCCMLHNIVIDMEDGVLDELPLSHNHDPGYRQEVCESADPTASVLRDKLSLYLSGRRASESPFFAPGVGGLRGAGGVVDELFMWMIAIHFYHVSSAMEHMMSRKLIPSFSSTKAASAFEALANAILSGRKLGLGVSSPISSLLGCFNG
ncbi:hypothetical protein RJ640_015553 [Escallonia rubra]|uniref:DDE Tnp4 domain-containing protein n=1 Tax=Escallonia rubra TaxID=112253 RepID=A0AA88RTE0_9ASTE|nr:hypothetical protein RJ640_015553 [Escallonia rubra]